MGTRRVCDSIGRGLTAGPLVSPRLVPTHPGTDLGFIRIIKNVLIRTFQHTRHRKITTSERRNERRCLRGGVRREASETRAVLTASRPARGSRRTAWLVRIQPLEVAPQVLPAGVFRDGDGPKDTSLESAAELLGQVSQFFRVSYRLPALV